MRTALPWAAQRRTPPDIDGVIYVTTDRHLNPGDFVDVKVTDSRDYDLIGREVL